VPGIKSDEIEKRRNRVREAALESIASRGQFNFRLDGADIKRLYALAKKNKRPVTSMVREWVLDRLEKEEGKKITAPAWARSLEQRIVELEQTIMSLVNELHSEKSKS